VSDTSDDPSNPIDKLTGSAGLPNRSARFLFFSSSAGSSTGEGLEATADFPAAGFSFLAVPLAVFVGNPNRSALRFKASSVYTPKVSDQNLLG
jgi:hypothetical protein